MLTHHRGFRAEQSVIRLLKTRKFDLIFQRARTKIAEIDLIFEKENRVLLVEVKTLSSGFSAFERIQKSQIRKLQSNRIYLAQNHPEKSFSTYVAFVEANQKISFCPID